MTQQVFVFGSNLAGRHGAIYGQGSGLQGSSYAIPTKDFNIRTLPPATIKEYVLEFIEFAKANKNIAFNLTPIGCGLAGYKYKDIVPMFADAPDNVVLPQEFINVLKEQQ